MRHPLAVLCIALPIVVAATTLSCSRKSEPLPAVRPLVATVSGGNSTQITEPTVGPSAVVFLVSGVEHGKIRLVTRPAGEHSGATLDDQVAYAVRALLAVPPPQTGAGKSLRTMAPEGTALLGVDTRPGLIALNISGSAQTAKPDAQQLPELAGQGGLTLLAQLVLTATQFSPRDGVQVLIDGKLVRTLVDGKADISRPRYRSELASVFIVTDNAGRRIQLAS